MTMKARLHTRNPFKEAVMRVIRGIAIDAERIHRAYLSLKDQDRDCMRYAPRMLQVEG
jgi:hypothetical protein